MEVEVQIEMANNDNMAKGLRWFQGVIATMAGVVLTEPQLITPYLAERHHGKVMAGAAILSALLPSLMGGKTGQDLTEGIKTGFRAKAKAKAKPKLRNQDQDPDLDPDIDSPAA